jgi:hypothetical protein
MTDQKLEMTKAELDAMLHRAAEEGARAALRAVGLGDEDAGNDIREVRGLLSAWRDTKSEAWKQTVRMFVAFVLMSMAAGIALLTWNYGAGSR